MKQVKKIIINILIFLTIILSFSTHWVLKSYNNASFEQIIFHITTPINGVEPTILKNYIENSIIISIIEYLIIIYIIKNISKHIKTKKGIKYFNLFLLVIICITILICTYRIGALNYFINGSTTSTFIEENYVESKDINITFKTNKKNLIYIFVESLESTYYSKQQGGKQNINLLPELYELSKENITFSNKSQMGGAYEIHGTSWTTAALVAQTSGIPLKMSKLLTNDTYIKKFLPNIYTLGEILEKEGYNQTIMFGSDANFGNRKKYFKNHGNYKIYDYYSAIKDNKIDNDYYVWWGYEDSKLFEYAKEELITLSNKKEPFNLTLLTSNTHYPNGYLEDNCKKEHDNKYANVISCTSYQINEFIKWVKEQKFYENTTIIIVGDHLSMNQTFFLSTNKEERKIFNLFINSSVSTNNTTNREFSTIDMFPTTLASIGATIEGNKLGLGTNLFSDEQTLIEKYGIEKVNKELSYKSNFYNKRILGY